MSTRPTSDVVAGVGGTGDPGMRAAVAYVLGPLCLPRELTAVLPPVGTLRLRATLVERRWCAAGVGGGGAPGELVVLTCAGQPAVLRVEPRTACVLVNAVLGLPQAILAGPLSRIERGVLEGTIASLLAKLGLPAIGFRGGAPDGWPAGVFALELSIGLADETGRAWLVASDASLERLWTTREVGDEAAPWLELARTRVPEHELVQAEVGDTIVFDEVAACAPAAAWPVRVLWRGQALAARWSADGVVGRTAEAEPEAQTQPERKRAAGCAAPLVEASAGVDIVARAMSARAPLIVSRGEFVGLRVGGHSFGRGTITQHEGAFAVVITQKASG